MKNLKFIALAIGLLLAGAANAQSKPLIKPKDMKKLVALAKKDMDAYNAYLYKIAPFEVPTDKAETEAEQPSQDAENAVPENYEATPSFPGGEKALITFLSKNMKYPAQAMEEGIQGKVMMSYVIDKDGSIVNPEVSQSVHPLLDMEALRIISSMPKWNPGYQKGKPVRAKYTFPVTFRLQ